MVLKIGFSFAVLAGLCFTSRLVCVQCMLYLVLFIDYERMEFIVLNDLHSWAMATCYLMYIFPRIFFYKINQKISNDCVLKL